MVEKSLSSKWNWLFLFHLLEKSIASLTTKTNVGGFSFPLTATYSCNSFPVLHVTQEFRDGPTLCWEKPEWHGSQLTGWRGASGLGTVPQSWVGWVCRASNNASSARRETVDTVEERKGKSRQRKHSSESVGWKIDDSISKKTILLCFI